MSLFFTSDLHIGHRLVSGIRGFWDEDNVVQDDPDDIETARCLPDTEAHDAALAEYWDATVHKKDSVWILGDIAVSGYARALAWFAERPGKKILIAGNHDLVHPMFRRGGGEMRKWLEVFDYIQPFARRKMLERTVLLSHFPYSGEGDRPRPDRYPEFRLRDEGFPLLHGHTHGQERAHGHQLHVGWDAWGRFVANDEVLDWLRELS
jgi:calcineurin-like phosphoesterase family protein